MFEQLHDHDPPQADARRFAEVAERARVIRRRRSAGLGALVVVVLGVGAIVAVNRNDAGDDRVLLSSAGPTTAAANTAPAATNPTATATPDTTPDTGPANNEPATTTTGPPVTAPPARLPADAVVAIGDSVMLGAATELNDFAIVDATESRNGTDAIELIESLMAANPDFAGTLVVDVGTNGPLPDVFAARLGAATPPTTKVVVMTVRGDGAWVEPNNAIVRDLADDSNAVLVDWQFESLGCPGDCFYDDGLHLRADGAAYYAELVKRGVDLASSAASPPDPGAPVPALPADQRPIVAIDGAGDAVYLPAGSDQPVLLRDGTDPDDPFPVEGEVTGVDSVAITVDSLSAWVGTCCEPVAGNIYATRPPVPAIAPSFYGSSPTVDPTGRYLAVGGYEGRLSIMWIGVPGYSIDAPPPDEFMTPYDLLWLDDRTILMLGIEGQAWVIAEFEFDGGTVERTARRVVVADGDDAIDFTYLFAGRDAVGAMAVHSPGSSQYTLYGVAEAGDAPRRRELPAAALSMWLDGDRLLWVDTARTMRDGDRVIPGEYLWARR